MEEDASSMVSNAKTNANNTEASDSNNSTSGLQPAPKRMKHDKNVSLVKFKGVVPQQNGHWGAQIYANHQRIWLGTFKSEREAAMAYDSAAIKIRGGDSHRNFPWTDTNNQEPNFQNQYSTEAVLNMIRDGTYQPKFADYLRVQSQREDNNSNASLNQIMVHGDEQFAYRQLFQKELTPSDVGKLNRLVIPKKYAVKYFPFISENAEENAINGGVDDMELVFFDKLMRPWKFRYCFWRSSQSYVFTRGWNRFVKEKKLKEKDIITFYACECANGAKEGQNFFLVDVIHCEGQNCNVVKKPVQLEQITGKIFSYNEKESNSEEKGFKLFGVQIN